MTAHRLPVAVLSLVLLFAMGFTVVRANVLGMGDRFDRLTGRIETFIDPPPDRSIVAAVVVTEAPSPSASATPAPTLAPSASPTPSPTPLVRQPVDVDIVDDPEAVFASQISDKWCAVAATQMVLTILGLGDTSDAFQHEIAGRIGEWESRNDSLNGGWGPAAVSQALAAYGEPGYREYVYESYADALRGSAIAISETNKPVVIFPWWGAHTWVMTGYQADADPTLFDDAAISGAYILDPWFNRVSSIWGPSDPPGNFEDLAELERNWPAYPGYQGIGPGWTRPEGAYPDRDGRYVVLLPTTPRDG